MKLFILISQLFCLTPAWAASFSIDVRENEAFVIPQENIVLLGHATQFWDSDRGTQYGVRTLVDLGKKYRLTTVATLYPYHLKLEEEVKQYYFTDEEVHYAVVSEAGQHRLLFPNVKNVFFVGGNLGRCLCEGIRDTALGFYQSPNFKTVNFYLVRDGIFDGYPKFDKMTPDAAKDFVRYFFVPAFDCPLQNWGGLRRTPMPNVAMEVFYDGQPLGLYDLEPQDSRPLESLGQKINVHFIHSSQIEEYLKKL
jgi:hypothetical protein